MNQKSFRITILCLTFSLLSLPIFSNNGGNNHEGNENEITNEQRLEELQSKADLILIELKELKKAKQAATSAVEKKAIRKQARELRGDLNALYAEGKKVSGGVYIGTGTLIVILLLILLL